MAGWAMSSLTYDILVDMRRHQTKQATLRIRTKLSKPTPNNPSTCANIIREFHNAQDEAAVGSGVERNVRWRAPVPGGREGVIDSFSTSYMHRYAMTPYPVLNSHFHSQRSSQSALCERGCTKAYSNLSTHVLLLCAHCRRIFFGFVNTVSGVTIGQGMFPIF